MRVRNGVPGAPPLASIAVAAVSTRIMNVPICSTYDADPEGARVHAICREIATGELSVGSSIV